MKKLILIMVAMCATCAILAGCTPNHATKIWGGESSVDLPKGEKLLLVTWKDDSLWVLTDPMENGYKAKVYKYRENSAYGVMQGTVTIREHEYK